MADNMHHPDSSPRDELPGAIRSAVEQIRNTPPPPEAVDRALDRAAELGSAPRRGRRWYRHPAWLGACAATLLCLAVAGWAAFSHGPDTNATASALAFVGDSTSMEHPDLTNTDLGLDDSLQTDNLIRFKAGIVSGSLFTPLREGEALRQAQANGRPKDWNLGPINPITGLPLQGVDPAPNDAENYAHRADNPFQEASRVPLSTFSIDVDTASYSNVRRFLLQENRLPPPDAVRLESLINYFPYDYARPKDEHPVAFTLDIAQCPWNDKHHLLRIALAARKIDPGQLPARNFVFLIDTSGSMSAENRLPLFKAALHLLVDQLTARDRVAIVAYAGESGLVLPTTRGDDKDTIRKAINRLNAEGSTNGGEGIVQAYRVAKEQFIKGGVNRVILGTDGDFNVGVTSEGDLVRLIEEQRKTGVYLSILGFGMGNLKDSTLEKLAHHGNGHYAYIDTLDEAKKVFVEQGAALVTLARDVKLQVEFNPKKVGAYRLLGYESRLLRAQDFNDDKKHAGDMGAGHTVTALYEIVPPGLPLPAVPGTDALKYQEKSKPTPAADSDEWLTVKLRYKDPESDTSKLLSRSLSGRVTKLADAPADFRFAAAVASFSLTLRNSPYKGSANHAQARELAKGALGADPGNHRANLVELVRVAERLAK
jgi:Ca-activated chloride channel family protein